MANELADLAQLLAVGDAQKQAIAASDPYLGLKQAPDLVSQVLMQSAGNQDFSTKDKIIAGLLSGLTSGALGGISADYQNRAQKAYGDVVQKDLLGTPMERPSVLSPSVFNLAGQQADIFRTQRQALQQQRDYEQGVKLKDKLLDQGIVISPEGPQRIESLDPAAQAQRKKLAEMNAEADAYGYNPLKEEETDKLRKEFSALPEVKNYSQVQKAASIINAALQDDNAVTDLELTRYSILLIEPGMAVREGEQAAVRSSPSIPQQWKGKIEKALEGKSELGSEIREGLKNLASRAYSGHKYQYDKALGFYQTEAQKKGLDPERISYIGESLPSEEIFKGPVAQDPQTQLLAIEAELRRRGAL